ncbi:MAG: hypothetical protein ACRCXT_23630 [Paraclostridium sp.]
MKLILNEFREFVNDNLDYMIDVYANNNGRNQWNCICACMNWIEVALDNISCIEYDEKNINIKCMQVYSYISAIDLIWESIKQLNRVIVSPKGIPFKDDTRVFEKQLDLHDNEYFKHLRAIFGAHPVNIKDPSNPTAKYFANWPNEDRFGGYDFISTLWTSDTGEEALDLRIGFKFSQLDEFLNIRHEYLNVLKDKLSEDINKHYDKMRKIKIESSDDIRAQLDILKSELEIRKTDDYYSGIIDNLIGFFNSERVISSNNPVIFRYLNELQDVINELKHNIQEMIFTELESHSIIYLSPPKELYYNLSKVYDYYNNYDINIDNYNFYIKPIAEFLKEHVDISYYMSYEECSLAIKAGLFEYWCKN